MHEWSSKKTIITAIAIFIIIGIYYLYTNSFSSNNKYVYEMASGQVMDVGTDYITVSGKVISSDPSLGGKNSQSRVVKFLITEETIVTKLVNVIDFTKVEVGQQFSPKMEKRAGNISEVTPETRIIKATTYDNVFEAGRAEAIEIEYLSYKHANFPGQNE